MIAAISDPTTSGDAGCLSPNSAKPEVSMNSDHAMKSATVPTTGALNSATNCGIAVILVFSADKDAQGDTEDETDGDEDQLIVGTSATRPMPSSLRAPSFQTYSSVAATAMPMPTAAIQLPRTAMAGPVSPDRP